MIPNRQRTNVLSENINLEDLVAFGAAAVARLINASACTAVNCVQLRSEAIPRLARHSTIA